MKKTICLTLVVSFLCISWASHENSPDGPLKTREAFIRKLLTKMTVEEKIGQLNQYSSKIELTGLSETNESSNDQLNQIRSGHVGSMLNVIGAEQTYQVQKVAVEETRLGIPLLFGYDVIHGYQTMFPIPLAEAASWEPELARLTSRAAAEETAHEGIHWTFAPMVDITWDARWGRIMEGAGEDPLLNAAFAKARVQGFQGDDLSLNNTIAACAKHFAGYGFVQAGRDYNSVDMSMSRLHNVVLPPFESAVEAGTATLMNAFNEVNGIPATGNAYLLKNILRDQWKFEGLVVSDWGSIGNMAEQGVTVNKSGAAQLAISAGTDIDMESRSYKSNLKELVESGAIDLVQLDESVLRVLRLKYDLGLFDDPYKYGKSKQELNSAKAEHLALSREVAKRSIVLLKNEGSVLPLSKSNDQKIAIIGELGADTDSPLGSWRAQAIPNSAISLVQAFDSLKIDYQYERGPKYLNKPGEFRTELSINNTDTSGLAKAISLASKSDIVLLVIGENCFQSGEGRSQVDIGLKGLQKQLFEEVHKVNPNIVVVLMNGRPLAVPYMFEGAQAVLETWHLGSASGLAITDVLFGDYNPSGKLPVTFPRSTGQLPLSYLNKPISHSKPSSKVFWSHYIDEANSPQFPFGFGLSYTTFEYSELSLSRDTLASNAALTLSVNVTNKGTREGEEVVQVYLRDVVSSESRPLKQLINFEKISLNAGEKKTVTFDVEANDLSYFYAGVDKRKVEEGSFMVYVGTNSEEVVAGQFYYTSK